MSGFEVEIFDSPGEVDVRGEGEESGDEDLREGDECAALRSGADDGFEGEDVGAAAAEDESEDPD